MQYNPHNCNKYENLHYFAIMTSGQYLVMAGHTGKGRRGSMSFRQLQGLWCSFTTHAWRCFISLYLAECVPHRWFDLDCFECLGHLTGISLWPMHDLSLCKQNEIFVNLYTYTKQVRKGALYYSLVHLPWLRTLYQEYVLWLESC